MRFQGTIEHSRSHKPSFLVRQLFFWRFLHFSSFAVNQHSILFVQVNLFQKLTTSAEHVVHQNCSECQNKTKTTSCVHNMFCRYSEVTILMNNEQSVIILWVSWRKNKSFWQIFTCNQFICCEYAAFSFLISRKLHKIIRQKISRNSAHEYLLHRFILCTDSGTCIEQKVNFIHKQFASLFWSKKLYTFGMFLIKIDHSA